MHIAALVSGGVDSSVALKLLLEQGHTVTAFYLKIWLEDELASLGTCPWEEDLSYVKAVCTQLKVPLKVLSLQDAYHERVIASTIAQAGKGMTPNPDILCNQVIKFGMFYDMIGTDYDKVATGHYAQITEESGIFSLKRGVDPIKDQSYFLSTLTSAQLSRALFPIGHLRKAEVRAQAKRYNLPTKDRKDSQGLCFLGKIKFNDFLAHHLGCQPGNIIALETGNTIGTHEGIWYYTIGQRQGIKLSDGPWYVVTKDPEQNTITVSNRYEDVEKERLEFRVDSFHWLSEKPPTKKNLLVKIRHRSTPAPCTLTFTEKGHGLVHLSTKDQGIAPGQFAVFYDDTTCLGSGIIQAS